MVTWVNAQNGKGISTNFGQKTKKPQTPDAIFGGIATINHQIDSLKGLIHSEYNEYATQKLYTDERFRNDSLASIETEKAAMQNKLNEDTCVINSLKEEYRAVDRIRDYYKKENIDTLFAHSDLTTLSIHKQILGEDYPKVMDDLHILLGCLDLLTKQYDEKGNKTLIQNLERVQQCDIKEKLEGFLLVQKDVTEEVDVWVKNGEHTLYGFVAFLRQIHNNYGITLDTDLPFLFAKVVEMIKLPSSTK